jgi:CRP-like cAMP-binding protein
MRQVGGCQDMLERSFGLMLGSRLKNRLLAGLPREILSSVQPHLKEVSLSRGTVLCDADRPLSHVYFVEEGAVSLVTIFEDGATAEMATIGREGMVGVDTLLGGKHALGRYMVSVPGSALAVEASRFGSALREKPTLRAACDLYAQSFFAHLLQNVACNATHRVEQRCARWLLMCGDQTDDDTIEVTQEYLAEMLGVRRSTVTDIASAFQKTGLIRYRRATITVLDRRGLETAACECYRIVQSHYEQLPAHAVG